METDFTKQAIYSAIAENPNEIIVSDDCSPNNNFEALKLEFAKFDQVKIIQTPKNLGLWENHFFLIKNAKKKWLKFLQQDDYLVRGGLSAFTQYAQDDVSLISTLPTNYDTATETFETPEQISEARCFSHQAYQERIVKSGYELGFPSMWLLNRTLLEDDSNIWDSNKSADLIVNILAARNGKIVIIPAGPVVASKHARQDGKTQSFDKYGTRLVNTLNYLDGLAEKTKLKYVREFVFTQASLFGFYIYPKYMFSHIFKNKKCNLKYLKNWLKILKLVSIKHLIKERANVISSFKRWKSDKIFEK